MGRRKKTMNEKGPKLLIVESPAKIKTISKFLGKDFRIMSTFGHVMDFPERRLGVAFTQDNKIELEYVPLKTKSTTINDICKQARECSEVFLASDPDREGEIISWHIGQQIEKVFADESKIHRITFNEITKPAIIEAIKHKAKVDINKVYAQQARRVLDRWVGYEVSPILWKKIAKGLSAGRVQSVALLLVCDREQEIQTFKPEEHWSIHAQFMLSTKQVLSAELFKISSKAFKLKNKEEAHKVLNALASEQFAVTKITDKKRLKNPQPPFMTSTLQQDAYNKLGFAVEKTMKIAQRLYEGVPLADGSPEALITYMRTDSLRIADTALSAVREFIGGEYGKDYLPKSAFTYAKKGAQDAHEAIRPIDVRITPTQIARFLSPDEAKLYTLIWKRFVACQMEAAEYFQRQVLIDGGKFTFKATGSTLMFDGFLKVYIVEDEEEEENVKIPKELEEKMPLVLQKPDSKQHFTQPPPRYTEASLVKELEKKGVGRPSTYAAILSTIQKRGYVDKENKRFMPTELGKAVTEMLVKNLPDIVNVNFTAKMEDSLDKIEQGKENRDNVLLSFYEKFKEDLEKFGGQEASRKVIVTDVPCPECGSPLAIRFGRTGEFLGCSKYPECKFTSPFTRDEQGKITLIEKTAAESELTCPQCGKNLVKKMGKFGPFLSCPGYPECKYIHQEKLKMPCPLCGKAVTKRRWRGGSFWGCSGYPTCKFAIFGAVHEEPCPKCASPYLLVVKNKDGSTSHVCPDKACGYSVVIAGPESADT
ncbi:MAG: topoisomerase protein [candidate division TM6 bacterium GW2011_GWF2_38_10]|nr:MAG: topoisomerase protein [candidate division TM6 bacterium GW2011_GWF2_38_10]